jgi:hypothetical protein
MGIPHREPPLLRETRMPAHVPHTFVAASIAVTTNCFPADLQIFTALRPFLTERDSAIQ